MKRIFLFSLLLFSCSKKYLFYQNGDIIFQISKSSQSEAIQLATHSKYTHVGIIYVNNNKYFVFEAAHIVKLTPLKDWINNGLNGKFVVKRLKNASEILTYEALVKMKKIGQTFEGKKYDPYFEWSDERIYCSELVWKIYKRSLDIEIGRLRTIKDFDLSSSIVKKKIKERYGDKIPMEEVVISPADMFESDNLITICSN